MKSSIPARGPIGESASGATSQPARGTFLVLEGIDGAGTTTQTRRLADAFRAEGRAVRETREPSDGPIGMLIRQILTGRITVPSADSPSWAKMALLFAADRLDHVDAEIEPFLVQGGIVISDRYDASSLAYQSAMSGADSADALRWIRSLNRFARRPDLTIVLSVSPDVAGERRARRGKAADMYEQSEFQRALSTFYARLDEHMPGDRIEVVEGAGTEEEVFARVFATASRFAAKT